MSTPLQTTPNIISRKILEFCEKVAGAKPVYVPVKALGLPRQCYLNCAKYVKEHSRAKIVYGWMVWESNLMLALELEHHAVIQFPNGNIFDLTPPVDGEKRILFLPQDIAPKTEILEECGDIFILNLHPANIFYPDTVSRRLSFGNGNLTVDYGIRSVKVAKNVFSALNPVDSSITQGKTRKEREAQETTERFQENAELSNRIFLGTLLSNPMKKERNARKP
jgi:hypothetical protein